MPGQGSGESGSGEEFRWRSMMYIVHINMNNIQSREGKWRSLTSRGQLLRFLISTYIYVVH